MNGGKIAIEMFNGSDFDFWKMQIEDYLYGKDLYLPLKPKPEKMSADEWELLNRKAMSVIRLSLSKDVAYHTTGAKSTREMLKILEEMYQKPSTANKVYLIRRLFNLDMSEGTPVQQHLNEFNMITAQLDSVDIKFDDELRALVMLSSLPDSWVNLVTVVSAGDAKLKFDRVRDLMIGEEIRKKHSGRNRREREIFLLTFYFLKYSRSLFERLRNCCEGFERKTILREKRSVFSGTVGLKNLPLV